MITVLIIIIVLLILALLVATILSDNPITSGWETDYWDDKHMAYACNDTLDREWNPIYTAPRDGSVVSVTLSSGQVVTHAQVLNGVWVYGDGGISSADVPVFWCPIEANK